ncbi:serine hydrolase [Rhodohalobacter sp. SW132]|uniref:serine hydrolase domain-containing protein n=1 Tax=Rhodohalobacter sp. SW132 TaxID=2293433 RepID=UPI001314426C|nr:serine hydrolase [Rhodohalobacter sp. SW132]
MSQIFDIGTIYGVMIEQDGELLFDEFRGGMDANRTTNIKSASKSVLSLLIGIAIDQQYLEGVDQQIGEFFPDYFNEHPDPVKESLTLKNLLTMRTGMETTSFHNYGRWVVSSNWIRFALNRDFEEEPGGRMMYSTGTSHLLSVILTRATGMSTLQFANQYLFGPMNITVGGWDRDPQGYYMGGNNVAISTEALLKLGRLVMDGGVYNGRRLISESWIEESLEVYTHSNFNDYNFGYMWWSKPVGETYVYFAWGNGGQYILMIPELDAVISITSDVESGSGSRAYQRNVFNFLEETILPFLDSQV